MGIDIKGILGSVAPTIAGLIGGPLAGTAVGAISNALLGHPDATQQEVEAAMAKATPEDLLKLKVAEAEFAAKMKQLDIDLAQVNAGDRDSARKREMAVRDYVPGVLAFLLTAGFFGLLGWMMQTAPPPGSRDLLNIMLGALGAGFSMMLAYYYGSSAGSVQTADAKK